MIHGSRSGLLDPSLGRYIILAPKWRLAREDGSTYFWRQNCALLFRADPLIFGAKTAHCCGGQIRDWETYLLDPKI